MGQLVYCYIGSPRNMESSAHERNLKIHANAPSLATQKQGKSFQQQCCSQFYESLIFHYLHGSLRRRYDKVREFESRKTVTSSIKKKMLEAFSLLWQYKSEHHGDLAITLENSQLRDEILGGHTKKFLFLTQKRGNYFHFQPFPTMSLIINFVFHPLHYYSYMYSSSYVVIISTTQSTSLLPSSLPSSSSFLSNMTCVPITVLVSLFDIALLFKTNSLHHEGYHDSHIALRMTYGSNNS